MREESRKRIEIGVVMREEEGLRKIIGWGECVCDEECVKIFRF